MPYVGLYVCYPCGHKVMNFTESHKRVTWEIKELRKYELTLNDTS